MAINQLIVDVMNRAGLESSWICLDIGPFRGGHPNRYVVLARTKRAKSAEPHNERGQVVDEAEETAQMFANALQVHVRISLHSYSSNHQFDVTKKPRGFAVKSFKPTRSTSAKFLPTDPGYPVLLPMNWRAKRPLIAFGDEAFGNDVPRANSWLVIGNYLFPVLDNLHIEYVQKTDRWFPKLWAWDAEKRNVVLQALKRMVDAANKDCNDDPCRGNAALCNAALEQAYRVYNDDRTYEEWSGICDALYQRHIESGSHLPWKGVYEAEKKNFYKDSHEECFLGAVEFAHEFTPFLKLLEDACNLLAIWQSLGSPKHSWSEVDLEKALELYAQQYP